MPSKMLCIFVELESDNLPCQKKIHLYAPSMALILMEFVEAQSSGVCFTIDPLTNEKDMLVIQTNYGLGNH